MGSIVSVAISYLDLDDFFKENTLPVYGSFMNASSIYSAKLPERGVLVMGNEANGINEKWGKYITQSIAIPQFGEKTAESLNVAMATGILLNEIRRG